TGAGTTGRACRPGRSSWSMRARRRSTASRSAGGHRRGRARGGTRTVAARVRLRDPRVGVGEGAEGGVDGAVVGHVVAGVGPRGRIPRAEPDRVDAEAGQVRKPGADAGQVTDAVAVAVGEALHVQLVDRGTAPEAGVGGLWGHGSSVILSP